jgi:hypothetical protein
MSLLNHPIDLMQVLRCENTRIGKITAQHSVQFLHLNFQSPLLDHAYAAIPTSLRI